MAVVVATGITADGGREVLALDVGDCEDEVFWRSLLTDLKRRPELRRRRWRRLGPSSGPRRDG